MTFSARTTTPVLYYLTFHLSLCPRHQRPPSPAPEEEWNLILLPINFEFVPIITGFFTFCSIPSSSSSWSYTFCSYSLGCTPKAPIHPNPLYSQDDDRRSCCCCTGEEEWKAAACYSCWIVYSYLMIEWIKGKSLREFRLEWKQNPFRVKCFPVIGGNCGVDRRLSSWLPMVPACSSRAEGNYVTLPILCLRETIRDAHFRVP